MKQTNVIQVNSVSCINRIIYNVKIDIKHLRVKKDIVYLSQKTFVAKLSNDRRHVLSEVESMNEILVHVPRHSILSMFAIKKNNFLDLNDPVLRNVLPEVMFHTPAYMVDIESFKALCFVRVE